MLNWERLEARRRTRAARTRPPSYWQRGWRRAAAAVAGDRAPGVRRRPIGLRHVDVIASVLTCTLPAGCPRPCWPRPRRRSPNTRAYNPSELHTWASRLIEAPDEDGAEPDDRPAAAAQHAQGGRAPQRVGARPQSSLTTAWFDAIAAAVDAPYAPRTILDDRRPEERQADALSELGAQVLERGGTCPVPVRRPALNADRVEDLQRRATGALLTPAASQPREPGGCWPEDAVVLIVMNGAG
ncbi:hypothetical protein HBB16_00795 [Pseudonocardia sp. MCCB 268]|nr:hypothetical protein [Pseudonocardia cytotoxica]